MLDTDEKRSLPAIGVCLLLLTFYWWLITFLSDPTSVTLDEFILVSSLALLVVAAQVALIACGAFLLPGLGIFIAALAAVANILSAYLLINTGFLLDSLSIRFVKIALGLELSHLFFSSMASTAWFRRFALACAASLFLFTSIQAARGLGSLSEPTGALTAGEGLTHSPNIRLIDLEHRPNLYVIFFDGMLPESVARANLGIQVTPGYVPAFERHEFRALRNHFSDTSSTAGSINAFLAMDQGYLDDVGTLVSMDSGHAPSPFQQILSANGYRISFFFIDRFQGPEKGHHIDRLQVPGRHPSYICDRKRFVFFLFGYCALTDPGLEEQEGEYSFQQENLLFVDWFVERAERIIQSESEPQLFLTYIYLPGHFSNVLEFSPEIQEEFIDEYLEYSSMAADAIETMVSYVDSNDPDAIILAMGDHGIFGGKKMDWDEMSADPGNLKNLIQLGYGVYGGIRDQGRCVEYIHPLDFSVNSWLARQLLRCLADGVDPFITEPSYSIKRIELDGRQLDLSIWGGAEPGDFADFLYE